MEILEAKKDRVTILELKGRLDSTSLKGLSDKLPALIEAGDTRIILDFSDLDYINSAGLRVLVVAAKQLMRTEGRIVICSMKDYIKEVFDISGFSTLFPIHASQNEALAEF